MQMNFLLLPFSINKTLKGSWLNRWNCSVLSFTVLRHPNLCVCGGKIFFVFHRALSLTCKIAGVSYEE